MGCCSSTTIALEYIPVPDVTDTTLVTTGRETKEIPNFRSVAAATHEHFLKPLSLSAARDLKTFHEADADYVYEIEYMRQCTQIIMIVNEGIRRWCRNNISHMELPLKAKNLDIFDHMRSDHMRSTVRDKEIIDRLVLFTHTSFSEYKIVDTHSDTGITMQISW